jgi:hypothetical protein
LVPLRIVSHNVFWFQGHPFAPDTPPAADARILASLTGIYGGLKPDLLCLQEIQDASASTLAGEALGLEGVYSAGCRLPQYGAATYWKAGRLLADSSNAAVPPHLVWQAAKG